MEHYTIHDAQQHLQQLIDDAQHGKTVLILDDNNRAVQLIPINASTMPRKAGSARGQVKISPDFDAPLPDFNEYTE